MKISKDNFCPEKYLLKFADQKIHNFLFSEKQLNDEIILSFCALRFTGVPM